jgi:hypothetical protein
MRYNSPKTNAGAQQSRWCFGWLMVVVYALDSIHVQYCKACRCPSGAWRCSLPLYAPPAQPNIDMQSVSLKSGSSLDGHLDGQGAALLRASPN